MDLYKEHGVEVVPDGAKNYPQSLYLDMVKRIVCNLIYQDPPLWIYDHHKEFQAADGFDLERRIWGEDAPTQAHTMVGWRRLSNMQVCAERIFAQGVPGDFVETGVLRGGSAIFLRALLRAYEIKDRRIYACDTFASLPATAATKKMPPRWLGLTLLWILKMVAKIPNSRWRFWLFRFLEARQTSFPVSQNPSPELIAAYMHMVQNSNFIKDRIRANERSVAAVRSHFARYGLLDEQVVFLEGFFAKTLPENPISSIALLHCDGDTFESTYDVLLYLYPKVSSGGVVIIDDYHSFADCRQAVDQFRQERNISAALIPVDHLSVYWIKP